MVNLLRGQQIEDFYGDRGLFQGAIVRLVWLKFLSVLAVTFNDGLSGIVDVSALVFGQDAGIFEALRDPAYFATAYLDCGAVTWSNGADLAPDAMHKEIRRCGVWKILD